MHGGLCAARALPADNPQRGIDRGELTPRGFSDIRRATGGPARQPSRRPPRTSAAGAECSARLGGRPLEGRGGCSIIASFAVSEIRNHPGILHARPGQDEKLSPRPGGRRTRDRPRSGSGRARRRCPRGPPLVADLPDAPRSGRGGVCIAPTSIHSGSISATRAAAARSETRNRSRTGRPRSLRAAARARHGRGSAM